MFFNFFKIFVDKIVSFYAKEKNNKGLWLVVIFASGIGCYFSLLNEPSKWLGLVLLEVSIVLAVLCRFRPYLLSLITVFGFFVLGFFVIQMRAYSVEAPVFKEKTFARNVIGRVLSVEEGSGRRGQRVVLDELYIENIDAEIPLKIRVVLTSNSQKVKYGDIISVRAVLNRPFFSAVAGANNFARLAWFDSLGAVGYAVSKTEIVEENQSKYKNFNFAVGNLRTKMSDRIKQVLPNHEGAIAVALISGERGGIPRYLVDAYRDSGLAHFLSISGLHMGLVGGFAFFLMRFVLAFIPKIALAYDTKKMAAVFAILITSCYLVVSGFRIPAERAYIMTTIVFLAVLVNRRAISMRLIAFAGFIVLFSQPEALISPSFQMSFAAVVALIGVYESINIRSFLPKIDNGKLWLLNLPKIIFVYVVGVLIADFVASVATLPFAVYHFNRIAVYTLLGNLLSAPLIFFIVMPFIVFSLMLMPLGWEYPFLRIAGLGIFLINKIVLWVSSLSGAVVTVKAMPTLALVLIVFGMLWLCLWREKWRYYGLILVFSGIVWHYNAKTPDIIAGDNGNLVAVKLENNDIALSSKRINFVSKVWFERLGKEPSKTNHNFFDINDSLDMKSNLLCDYNGCVYSKYNQKIAILKKIDDIKTDCQNADLIISPFPIKNICKHKLVIDFWDFKNNGTYSIFILPSGRIKINNVKASIGNRLWTK